MENRLRYINLVFVLLFAAYSAYTIFFRQAGIFFIVYLFWFDEVIRNISLLVQLRIGQKNASDKTITILKKSRSTVLSRFFFLFVYAVFIVIAFGIFFHLGKDSRDELVENVKILFFIDPVFNLCLCIAVVREVIIIRTNYMFNQAPVIGNAMDGHIVTMHLSILLGGAMVVLTGGDHPFIGTALGGLKPFAIILPFLIIKLIVDIYTIYKHKAVYQPQNT